MASSREYHDYIMELLGGLYDIDSRYMMGEYVIYYHGKVFGGIYDDRFLIKKTPTSERMLPDAERTLPYPDGSEMIAVDSEDSEFLCEIVDAMIDEVPATKKRRKKR